MGCYMSNCKHIGICASSEAFKVVLNRSDLQATYAPDLQ